MTQTRTIAQFAIALYPKREIVPNVVLVWNLKPAPQRAESEGVKMSELEELRQEVCKLKSLLQKSLKLFHLGQMSFEDTESYHQSERHAKEFNNKATEIKTQIRESILS